MPSNPPTLSERLRAAEPIAAEVKSCGSCGARIVWARSSRGKPMPVDVEPCVDGNVVLMREGDPDGPTAERGELRVVVLGPLDVLTAEQALRKAHFATCPQADQWRSR